MLHPLDGKLADKQPSPPTRFYSHKVRKRPAASVLASSTRSALTMSSQNTQLTAAYSSPSSTHAFSHSLPLASANNVSDKTAYLSALRSKSTELQSEINAFLTKKMEEDAKGVEGKRSKNEEREEEMYGEEDPEADG